MGAHLVRNSVTRRQADTSHVRFNMLAWMDTHARDAFIAVSHRRVCAARQTIYTQSEAGEEMYLLVSGSVRMSVRGVDGREATFLLMEPGDFFGNSSVVDGEPRPHTAEALTKSELLVLPRAGYLRLVREHPSFIDALLRLLSQQMRAVSAFYVDSQLSGLRVRVIHRIHELITRFGIDGEEGMRLSIRVSQSELASLVGSSRQSVGKILKDLQAEGIIRIEYGNLLVPDSSRLAAAVHEL